MLHEDKFIRSAKLLSVIDGDTIECLVDLGFNIHKKIKLRLKDVYASEITGETKQDGVKHKRKLKSLLRSNVLIQTFKNNNNNDVKTFDRYVAIIFVGNKNINEELIKWIKKN